MFAKLKKQPLGKMAPLSTLVAEGVEITGDLSFAGGMRIDGRVHGNVVGAKGEGRGQSLLVLSDKGRIEGSVRCANAVINGIVTGDLDVELRLELQSDARVCGTVRYRQLQVDIGASITGQLERIDAAATGGNVIELGADKGGPAAERR